ncbi:MAG: dTDP-4-dehydrorhamnose 3,5-epimerase family protein [Rickettsiales bacterium]|nr:dTDP-4-dehydrorhamnose 3,5-epimerase family protein [Rickettsiales bacterium]
MEFIESKIKGCYIIKCNVHSDNRGSFAKIYNKSIFKKNGIDINFDESFFSVSKKDCIRGMHFQNNPNQVKKLVSCFSGEVLDVFLDIRKDSPTYGLFESVILSEKNSNMVLLCEGIAHGFLTLTEKSIVNYLQSGEFCKDSDNGILWNSFGFDWGVKNPIISERDSNLIKFL